MTKKIKSDDIIFNFLSKFVMKKMILSVLNLEITGLKQ